ncbi:MAG: TIGR00159 family protein [Gemmatimonadetes bacterium]|uniref:Diadenylate cyclase n=1 Tax=Candidatus Kutchimonas denitrificans TaxID=3056748 RepID=A0AAE4Z700_9BACT|nr:TIGR00159 family protein [Gemmatimonadota bacterium]NIR74509.1 TIGR00159 family protein [Candidatus Kutchimonas denitrificans]NIS02699.1 TIGR00159 family protein [Gemmatimonadota bacterium]NIT68860.1 TIGR00159 family protein [Gemmatimonadota bacterium]NIU52165.1 TIGR00159 family protein [Gemmatimonadota bacterium]
MQSLIERISFLRPDISDLIQIAVVAYLFYRLLLLWAGTRALQMLLGLILLFAAYALAEILQLELLRYLLGFVFTYGVLAAIIIFQPELRGALTRLGQTRFWRYLSRPEQRSETLEGLSQAVETLARKRIGAIIAIEREVGLEEYARRGAPVNAPVTPELIEAIFTRYGPLHDGAVIIRGQNILAARCILPLTQFPVTDRSLGTRHRAAIGLSEETDAIVIVVSEETGAISISQRGRLDRNVSGERLREVLGAKGSSRSQLAASAGAPQQAPSGSASGELSLVDRSSSAS